MRRRACATPGSSCATPRPSACSIPQVAPRELEEHVLQARGPVQVDQLALPRQALQQWCHIFGVAKDGVADAFDPRGKALSAVHPSFGAKAVDLDHLRLDVLGDQRAWRATGDDASAIHDREALTQPLGLL